MPFGMVTKGKPEEGPMRKLRIFLTVKIKALGIQIEWTLTLHR